MQDGESTWYFYVGNNSVEPPSVDSFLKMLCKQYDLPVDEKNLKRLTKIHEKLSDLALRFARLNLDPEKRDSENPTGILLQLFVPPTVLDQVGYASLPYGKPDTRSWQPVSMRCETLKTNPRAQPLMQVRLLIQSIFVPDHRITVISHGCGDFFSDFTPSRLSGVSSRDWDKQKLILQEKTILLSKAKQIFLHMVSTPSVSKK